VKYPLTTIALGPLLLVQAISTRRKTPILPEPPGDRQGTAGDGPSLRLLIVGDSSAAGVGAPHLDDALPGQLVGLLAERYCVSWRLEAKTGDRTADAIARLKSLATQPFDVAVTSLGVNDVTGLVGRRTWCEQQRALRDLLRSRFGVRSLILSGLPPMHGFPALPQPLRWHLGVRASQFNDNLCADAALEPDVTFIDLCFTEDITLMADDGFHPGPDVYAEWAKRIDAALGETV